MKKQAVFNFTFIILAILTALYVPEIFLTSDNYQEEFQHLSTPYQSFQSHMLLPNLSIEVKSSSKDKLEYYVSFPKTDDGIWGYDIYFNRSEAVWIGRFRANHSHTGTQDSIPNADVKRYLDQCSTSQ